ncbi:hypothetical protein BOTBODRAFT_55018 [Botryobasidium botryosum FD-172 SS1]|uniref:Uncharacterized protein n=1 Tax=Botryobasidium botryosum (strain FD-172 SS1) TaxID=930990 RepID=A0A067MGA1_BOTB1|nr:hypothetical protein BOTBODRAFT_55018 [Botryobasidium botryosum FD-172 SS1]
MLNAARYYQAAFNFHSSIPASPPHLHQCDPLSQEGAQLCIRHNVSGDKAVRRSCAAHFCRTDALSPRPYSPLRAASNRSHCSTFKVKMEYSLEDMTIPAFTQASGIDPSQAAALELLCAFLDKLHCEIVHHAPSNSAIKEALHTCQKW